MAMRRATGRACASGPRPARSSPPAASWPRAANASRSARRCRWSTGPAKPTEARIALFTDNWLGASIAAVIGVVGLAGGLLVRRSVRRELGKPLATKSSRMSTRFDREYYRRFYFDGRTAVTSRVEMRARARLIAAYADHIGLPVRRMLDAGCGIGLLRAPLQRAFPRARYTGLEYSEYLCKRYGWTQRLAGRLACRPVRSRGLLRRAAVPGRPHGGARHRQSRPPHARRAVPVGAHAARLARELRSLAHRSRRAPAPGGVVRRAAAPLVPPERRRASGSAAARRCPPGKWKPPQSEAGAVCSRACTNPCFPSMPPPAMHATVTCARRCSPWCRSSAPRLGKRLFWRLVLFIARFPAGLRLLQRLRGS